MASISFFSRDEGRQPDSPVAQAEQKLQDVAAISNEIYVFELFVAVPAVFQLCAHLRGREVILFADSEDDCAALTDGAAKNKIDLALVYPLWAIAAQYDIGVWTERVPTSVNPAGHPPRGRELTCATEPRQDLASINGLAPKCDLPWMTFRRTD